MDGEQTRVREEKGERNRRDSAFSEQSHQIQQP